METTTRKVAVPRTKRGWNSTSVFTSRKNKMSKTERAAVEDTSKNIIDAAFYAVKYVGDEHRVEMFSDNDMKKTGITNVSSGKLEKGEPFACTGMILLTGNYDGTGEDPADAIRANYGQIHELVRNGHFKFTVNGGIVVVDDLPNDVFATHRTIERVVMDNGHVADPVADPADVGTRFVGGMIETLSTGASHIGHFEFDNPVIIETQSAMDLVVEWGADLPTGTYMKVILLGSKVK